MIIKKKEIKSKQTKNNNHNKQTKMNKQTNKRQKQNKPEALKSLYRSPGYKKNQLVLCKN